MMIEQAISYWVTKVVENDRYIKKPFIHKIISENKSTINIGTLLIVRHLIL